MKYNILASLIITFSIQIAVAEEPSCLADNYPDQVEDQGAGITYNGRPGEFFRNSFAPRSDNLSSYTYYPSTGYFVGESNLRGILYQQAGTPNEIFNPTTTDAKKYIFHWANRCNSPNQSGCGNEKNTTHKPNTKGNTPQISHNGEDYRFYFTTYDKANMCTLAQARYLLGFLESDIVKFLQGDEADDSDDGWGLEAMTTEQDVIDRINGLAQGAKLTDICYLYGENGTLVDHIDGIVLDYEVQDNRADIVTSNFLRRYSNNVRSRAKTPMLWTNPVLSYGWVKSGFSNGSDGNAHLITLSSTPPPQPTTVPSGMGIEMTSILVHKGTNANTAAGPLNCGTQSIIQCQLNAQSRALFEVEYDNSPPSEYNKFSNRQKMYVIVGIEGFTLDQADEVRQFVGDRKLRGIATWNNEADFRRCTTSGNEIQYKVVECLALGDCSVE